MDPITISVVVLGLVTFAGGVWHAENLNARSMKQAARDAAAAERRSIEFALEQERKAEEQLSRAMARTNPYGSNTAGSRGKL